MKMGRAKWRARSTVLPQNESLAKSMEVRPEMGNTAQWMPKSSMSSKASQNPGTAKPMNTKTVAARSNKPPCQ